MTLAVVFRFALLNISYFYRAKPGPTLQAHQSEPLPWVKWTQRMIYPEVLWRRPARYVVLILWWLFWDCAEFLHMITGWSASWWVGERHTKVDGSLHCEQSTWKEVLCNNVFEGLKLNRVLVLFHSYNRMKDFAAVAGQLGVSHLLVVSQTDKNVVMRISRFPNGPTLHFRIGKYSLARQVRLLQKRPFESPAACKTMYITWLWTIKLWYLFW